MKKTIRKIALALSLAFFAILLCIFGAHFLNGGNSFEADAADTPVTVTVTCVPSEGSTVNGKTVIAPGSDFTIKVTIKSTVSNAKWDSLDISIAPLNPDGSVNEELLPKLSLVKKSFKHNFDTYGVTDNLQLSNNYFYKKDDPANPGDAKTTTSAYKYGLYFSMGVADPDNYNLSATSEIQYEFKLHSDEDLGDITFGVPDSSSLQAGILTNGQLSATSYKLNKASQATVSPVTLRVGSIDTDPSLKEVHVGHENATESLTVQDAMTAKSSSATTNNYKIRLTPTKTTTALTYGVDVAAATSVTCMDEGYAEFTITLNSSGVTVVNIHTVAEDGEHEKDYTLTITSSYARLSAMTIAQVGGTTGVPGTDGATLGLQESFAEDTTAYHFTVAADSKAVDITPTIKTGYGATGVVVSHTGTCTVAGNVESAGKLSVTGIEDGASVTLTVTAKDGSTTQAYKIDFKVVDTDTKITKFTMTCGGETVNNDSAKASSNSADYYFILPEKASFKGKFNITKPVGSSITIKKDGGSTVGESDDQTAGTYTVTITSAFGNTHDYKVILQNELKVGKLDNLQYCVGSSEGSYQSVDLQDSATVTSTSSGNDTTYTIKMTFDPNDYGETATFFVQGTPSTGASVTAPSPLTANGENKWKMSLSYKTVVEGTITASTSEGKTIYKFQVGLFEKKNTVESVNITGSTYDALNETFSAGETLAYSLEVPYECTSIDLNITTDANYSNVTVTVGSSGKTVTETKGNNTHEVKNIAITSNSTVIKIIAYADQKSTASLALENSGKGKEYTITITRGAADADCTLSSLELSVNNSGVTFDEGSFNPQTLTYTYTMTYEDNNSVPVAITAIPTSDKASMKFKDGTAGEVNMTSGETKSSTFAFSFTTAKVEKTYTVKVTAQSGASSTYTIKLTYTVPKGAFEEFEISTDSGSYYQSVMSDFEGDEGGDKTYTINYDISEVSVKTVLYIKPTANAGAQITTSSGVSKKGDHYEYTLTKFGVKSPNELYFISKSGGGQVKYTLKIGLYEDKDDFEDIAIVYANDSSPIPDYSFSRSQYSYNISIPSDKDIKITLTAEGQYVKCYEKSSKTSTWANGNNVPLEGGKTKTFVFYCVANNGEGMSDSLDGEGGQEYTFNITKEKADETRTLKSLQVTLNGQPLTLSPVFSDQVTSYTIDYVEETPFSSPFNKNVRITAAPTSDKSQLSGDIDKDIPFTIKKEGNSATYTVTVTPESGLPNTYTIVLHQTVLDSEAKLANLKVTVNSVAQNFDEPFNSEIDSYNLYIKSDLVGKTAIIEAVATKDSAKVNNTLHQITETVKLDFAAGNTITKTYEVVAEDGITSKTYTLNIILQSGDTTLKGLTVSVNGKQQQFVEGEFSSDITEYTIEVDPTMEGKSLSFKPTTNSDGASYEISPNDAKLSFNGADEVTYTITVKAEDGSEQEYTVTFRKLGTNAWLADLAVKINNEDQTFEEGMFDAENLSYTVKVKSDMNGRSVSVNAVADAENATVNGETHEITDTFSLNFGTGKTITKTYKVVAEDGKTTKIYTLSIELLSDDATLKNFSVSVNGKNQNFVEGKFDPATNEYTLEVDPSLEGKPLKFNVVPESSNAQVDIYPSPDSVQFDENGEATYTVTVTAEDGTQMEYTLKLVKKEAGSTATIDIDGKTFEFDTDTGEPIVYRMPLYDFSKTSINVKVNVPGDGTYTISRVYEENRVIVEPNGADIDSGNTFAADLYYGSNVFQIDIEKPDGTIKKLAIVVERDKPYFTSLSSDEIAALKNDYSSDKDAYAYTVSPDTDKLTLNYDYDKSLFDSNIQSSYDLKDGANEIAIELYAKGDKTPVRTITLSVFREQEGGADNTFWFIMFWILIALSAALVVIIFLVRRKGNSGAQDDVIYAPASNAPAANQQPQVVVRPDDDYYGY